MAEQLFQIGVKAVIQNEEGKILLLAIRAWKDIPNYWDIPGGRMEPGESFIETLRRELKEEIGYDYTGKPQHMATVMSNISIPVGDKQVPLILMPHIIDVPDNIQIVLDPDSSEQDYEWVFPPEAARRLLRKYPLEFCDMVATL